MNMESVSSSPLSTKKARLSCDERIQLNRERNRMHARKTRERKKLQTLALQMRISELQEEARHLRQVVDEKYTASALLGLSHDQSEGGSSEETLQLISSANLCGLSFAATTDKFNTLGEQNSVSSELFSASGKRVRRRGKYTPQQRERIRRERNRMHAKKTRDRKKIFLEASEQIIIEMEQETCKLRQHLVSLHLMTHEEQATAVERDTQSRKELALLKVSQNEYLNDDEYDDELPSASLHGAATKMAGTEMYDDDEEEGYNEDEYDYDNIEEAGGYERDNDNENDGSGGSVSGSESSDQKETKAGWKYSDSSSSSSSSCSGQGRSSNSGGGMTTVDSAGNSCNSNSSSSGVNSGSGSGSDDGNELHHSKDRADKKTDALASRVWSTGHASMSASSLSNNSSSSPHRDNALLRERTHQEGVADIEEELTNSDGSSNGGSSGNGSGGTSPLHVDVEDKACQTTMSISQNVMNIAHLGASASYSLSPSTTGQPLVATHNHASKPTSAAASLNEEHLYLQGVSDALYRYQNDKVSRTHDKM